MEDSGNVRYSTHSGLESQIAEIGQFRNRPIIVNCFHNNFR